MSSRDPERGCGLLLVATFALFLMAIALLIVMRMQGIPSSLR